MPLNIFGNSSSNDDNKNIDASLFVQKLYSRTNYREAKFEEDIDKKNHYKMKSYPTLSVFEMLVVKIIMIIYPKRILISMMLNQKKIKWLKITIILLLILI